MRISVSTRPLYEQFFLFLKGLFQGNLGVSYVYKRASGRVDPVSLCPQRLSSLFAAVLLSLIVGVPLGLAAGWKPDSPFAGVIMIGSIFRLQPADFLDRDPARL